MPGRRKPAPQGKGQLVLGALAKVLPTGTTDVKKKRRGAPASPSHKGRNGLMLLAAGAAAAAAKKRRGQSKEAEVVVTEPIVTTNATAPPVAPRA